MTFVTYVTREGDRWDLIAHAVYGDPWDFGAIIAANPDVPIRPVLEGGLRLLIPVREPQAVGGLPPWKR